MAAKEAIKRLRAWWRKRREVKALELQVEAREGLLWAVREVDEVRAGAPEGSAVMLAKDLSEARSRLEERRARP